MYATESAILPSQNLHLLELGTFIKRHFKVWNSMFYDMELYEEIYFLLDLD